MRLKAHLLACAALTALSTPAMAQSETETPVTTDVITVTTQKREQSLADVPINLTAFNAQRLSALGIEQFDDLSDFVPGWKSRNSRPITPAL